MKSNTICFSSAHTLAQKIRKREISAREVMEAFLVQIAKVNPKVNAIVSINEEIALKGADEADRKLQAGEEIGPLHGLPIAIKDTVAAKGFPTTEGSVIFKDHIAKEDNLVAERLRHAGAIIIGKTNVPEFGAGAHTFNHLFGKTLNPYNLERTAGGSSGGAAVAVATGMIPLADGSDTGGSLRYPAAFNNVVGLRTSPGRVPRYPKSAPFSPQAVQGPIARSVSDAAFMMSVIAGPDDRSPIAIEEPGSIFLEPLDIDMKGLKIAYSPDLGGELPVDRDVREVFEEQIQVFEALGCDVEEAYPDFTGADDVFRIFRAHEFESSMGAIMDQHRDVMKSSLIWNIEVGRQLKGTDIGRADRLRTALFHRVREFFQNYDAFLLPVSQVSPFDVNLEYPETIDGVKMENYLDWMKSCYYVTATGSPALSVPGGFTKEGLPFGLQIVGPHRKDFDVLRIGYAFEQATNYGQTRPTVIE